MPGPKMTVVGTYEGASAKLTMHGQYVAVDFHIASDGHGGTLVTDPPLEDHHHHHELIATNRT